MHGPNRFERHREVLDPLRHLKIQEVLTVEFELIRWSEPGCPSEIVSSKTVVGPERTIGDLCDQMDRALEALKET